MLAHRLLQAADAVAAQDKPDFQGAETPAQGELVVAVVFWWGGFVWWVCGRGGKGGGGGRREVGGIEEVGRGYG